MAKLDGGRGGEIVLMHNPTAMNAEPTVIQNLKYFAAPRNGGFVLMPAQVQAFRRTDKKFETKNTNGFMITVRRRVDGRPGRDGFEVVELDSAPSGPRDRSGLF